LGELILAVESPDNLEGSPLEVARVQMPPVYLLAEPVLLTLSPPALFMQHISGSELIAEVLFATQKDALLLDLRRETLTQGGKEPAASEIALRPQRIESDTRVSFRVPHGLSSGLYRASLRDTVNQRSSPSLPVLVLQQELGSEQIETIEPGDGVIGEDFHGPLNATFKPYKKSD